MSGSMTSLMRLGDEFLHLEVVPALGDLQDRFADLLEFLVVGAEAH